MFKSFELMFNSFEYTFRTVESPFKTIERRIYIGIKNFSYRFTRFFSYEEAFLSLFAIDNNHDCAVRRFGIHALQDNREVKIRFHHRWNLIHQQGNH